MKRLGVAVFGAALATIIALTWQACQAEIPVPRVNNIPRTPYSVCYEETESIDADKAYLLVDLSDNTNWPHTATNLVVIKRVWLYGAVSSTHTWRTSWGVITENDATNGTAQWLGTARVANVSGVFNTRREFGEHGLSLRVASGAMDNFGGNSTLESTSWQNDTAISSTVATSGTVGVGDLVFYADEVTDGSTLDFTVCVDYDTE